MANQLLINEIAVLPMRRSRNAVCRCGRAVVHIQGQAAAEAAEKAELPKAESGKW
jgi:hypothetical protein